MLYWLFYKEWQSSWPRHGSFGFHPELFSNPVSQATVKTGLQDFVLLDAFILILLVEQEFFLCSCELLCIFVVHLLTHGTSQLSYYEKKILKFSLDIEKSQISHLVLKSIVCLFWHWNDWNPVSLSLCLLLSHFISVTCTCDLYILSHWLEFNLFCRC